jgi:hypothetical protein
MTDIARQVLEEAHYEFHYLERYLFILEQFLINESAANLENVKGGKQSIQDYLVNVAQLQGFFPVFLRGSALVTIYSMAEIKLNKICQLIEQRDLLTISVDKVKAEDQSIRKAKKYLTDVAHITFPNSPEWQNLLYYQVLRNCVVHNKGIINHTTRNNHLMLIHKLPGLDFMRIFGKNSSRIILYQEFGENMIDNIRSFFEQLAANL